jgi:hypothetical protein
MRALHIAVVFGVLVLSAHRNLLLLFCVSLLALNAFSQAPPEGALPRAGVSAGLSPGVTMPAKHGAGPDSLGIAYPQYLWPKANGVATVFYQIDSASDPNATPKIQTAISTFNSDFPGIIQWVEWNSSDGPNYVDINLSADNASGECEALEGYEAVPAQPMSGSTTCAVGTILHEMGHIIGLWHEQSRPDRNTYITVNYNNVIKGSWSNFEVDTDNAQIFAPYDYASVMEYPPYSFSRNGGPVIETIPAGIPLSGVEGVPAPSTVDYSATDKETIERLYGAPPTEVTVTSNPIGLQVVVDGDTVTTPQTYAWALNSTHTLDVATGVQTLTGDIENSTTSTTFYYTYGRWNDSTAQSHTITVTPGSGGTNFPATSPQVATYSANFIELVPYTAAVYPASSGQVAISPVPQTYTGATGKFFVARQQATLTATPASGWNFYEFNNGPFWLPGGLGANPKTFYVPDTGNPVNTTAEFSNTPIYMVDMTPETFSSNLYVYVDGDFAYTPKNYSSYYDSSWTYSSSHTLSLSSPEYPYSSNSRYAFSHWSDGGAMSHSITSLPGSSTKYTATVTPQFLAGTNFDYPPCGGSASVSPASPTNDGFYPTGQVLTYAATPDTDWTFAGWTYDVTGTANPTTLTASDETLVFANFNTVNTPLTLTSLSPATATAGGSGFTLTLTGTGFSPGSVVYVNGQYPVVTYVSSTTLKAPATAAAIANPGAFQVYVENYPSGWNGCAVFGYQTYVVQGSGKTSLAAPAFSVAAGSYPTAQKVALSESTKGATMYYTTNGTRPSGASTKYAGAIAVSSSETLQAIAEEAGYSPSPIATAAYNIGPPAATPKFSVAAGTYSSAQSVTISDTTSGATIYYTTNNTTPTTSSAQYSTAIVVAASETLQAMATAPNYSPSAVAKAAYTINYPQAATPTFSVPAGSFSSAQSVTISDTTTGNTIYYTTNNTTPTTSSTKYSAAVAISTSETLQAIAAAPNYTQSAVASATYTITATQVATPGFSVAAGTYSSPQRVALSETTKGATMYYTLDGTTPTTSSTKYAGSFVVSSSETVEAIGVEAGYTQSAVAKAIYTID